MILWLLLLPTVPQTSWLLGDSPALATIIIDTAWVRTYDGAGSGDDAAWDIVVDASGNVYVTGEAYGAGTAEDYLTIKYAPDGTELWHRTYNGPEDTTDEARALTVDDSGNVYVTGTRGTVKYDADGNQLWVRPWGGVDITLDSSNSVCVTGGTSDFITIKYYPDGDTAWVRTYNGPGDYLDAAVAVAVDDSENVYVAGRSYGDGTYEDYATIKYHPQGDTAWIRRYNGPGNWTDWAYALAVDDSGNVYVTGGLNRSGTDLDLGTIKYYPHGDTAWVRRYEGRAGGDDLAVAISVDGSGQVYVTGISVGTGWDYVTMKYHANGDTAWVRRYNGPGDDWDWSYDIAVDGWGNTYATGFSQDIGTLWDYTTIGYDASGNQFPPTRYNGSGDGDDAALAIAIDDFGNVYVTGFSQGTGTGRDYTTIKYVQADRLRGDLNGDWVINVADIIGLINYLFMGGSAPDPFWVGDANCDEAVDVADVIYLVNYLFIGGSPPCES